MASLKKTPTTPATKDPEDLTVDDEYDWAFEVSNHGEKDPPSRVGAGNNNGKNKKTTLIEQVCGRNFYLWTARLVLAGAPKRLKEGILVVLILSIVSIFRGLHVLRTHDTMPTRRYLNQVTDQSIYRAAHGQDRWLLDHVFKTPEMRANRTFVEAGVYDGTTGSNAYALEAEFGWKGLCYEPNPKNFELAKQSRPECKKINGVICNPKSQEKVTFTSFKPPNDQEGGIIPFMDQHKQQLVKDYPVESTVDLPCRDLSEDVVDSLGVKEIDVLFLDVEGSELTVLQSINFSNVRIKAIMVECSHEEQVNKFLTSKGYQHVAKVGDDNVFFLRGGGFLDFWMKGCKCEECKHKLVYPSPQWMNCDKLGQLLA